MPRSLAYPKRSHSVRRYPGPRNGPLSNEQKAAVAMLAREAFAKVTGGTRSLRSGEPPLHQDFETWRRAEQLKACGCDSLRAAGQEHYKRLIAHFLNLKGESAKAMNLLIADQLEPLALARRKLREALAEAGLDEGYAQAICRAQNKCCLDEVKDAKAIWRLVFTITNRGNARKRNDAESRKPGSQEEPNWNV